MKKLAILFTLTLMLLSTLCESPTNEAYTDLSGTVFDAETGEPINYAELVLLPDAGASSQKSDIDGKFCFPGLNPGTYIIQVRKTGYETNRKTTNVTINKLNNVDIPMTKIN